MERRTCSFCGNEIEPGTGKMYIKKDGTVYYFCKSKCQKNLLHLKRVPHRIEWTSRYAEMKSVRLAPEREKKAARKKKAAKKAVKKTGTKKAKKPSSKKKE
ncbi:MAG: 50S ribosomal protein L24e [Methanomassiliicoccales archaeon]|nr:MAG: 50S ribosomal protein L24e [Methanomassiliicoccales archaeon]